MRTGSGIQPFFFPQFLKKKKKRRLIKFETGGWWRRQHECFNTALKTPPHLHGPLSTTSTYTEAPCDIQQLLRNPPRSRIINPQGTPPPPLILLPSRARLHLGALYGLSSDTETLARLLSLTSGAIGVNSVTQPSGLRSGWWLLRRTQCRPGSEVETSCCCVAHPGSFSTGERSDVCVCVSPCALNRCILFASEKAFPSWQRSK